MQIIGNSARRSENFNGVSDKLKQELIKPIESEEAIFLQLLNGTYEPTTGRECFGASRSIRLKDRIFDPYAVNEEGKEVGAYIEIGVPELIEKGTVVRCKKIWVESIANGIPGNGQFSLRGGSIEDMEAYEFLCLSNGNKNNPYRGKSKQAEFEIIDVTAVAKAQKEKDFKELKAKLNRFAKDNPIEAAELTNSMGKKKEVVT